MNKTALTRVIAIASCLTLIPIIASLAGCARETVTIPANLEELSLIKIWDTVSKATDVPSDRAELESLRLQTDKDEKVNDITFIFHEDSTSATSKTYQVDINGKGELDVHSYGGLSQPSRNPLDVLAEIDKVKLSSIKPGEGGISIQADFELGGADGLWDNSSLNIYQLQNGNLVPLKQIAFNGSPFCVISVYQLIDGGMGGVTTTAARGERTTTQTWFLTEDVSKARVVQYQ